MLKVKRLKKIYTIQTVNIEKLINPIWFKQSTVQSITRDWKMSIL